MKKPEVLILGYHKIGPQPPDTWTSWYYTPTALFVRHLEWLREEGYAYLNLESFLRGAEDPASLPEKSALVTFDDGYRSILRHGLPEMEAAGCPGVIFVPTQYVGGRNDFDLHEEPSEEILSWAEMRELEKRGIALQSHGVTHRGLSGLSLKECKEEIVTSKAVLEEHLHRPVLTYSFPYGDGGTPDTADVVQELLQEAGYRAAFRYGPEPKPFSPENLFQLGRIGLGMDTDLAEAVAEFKHA